MSNRRLRIPVKFVDGHWELLYGGGIGARNGSIAELHLKQDQIEDEGLRKVLSQMHRVQILKQGVQLRAALSVREGLPGYLARHFLETKWDRTAKVSVESRFVPIWLGAPTELQAKKGEKAGGLWLELQGMEPRGLESSSVNLPKGLDVGSAISVNHAFTLLSERFEPWRKSHTGNIYERVFYLEDDGTWYPLRDLRDKELVQAERAVVKALWAEVARVLGKSVRP